MQDIAGSRARKIGQNVRNVGDRSVRSRRDHDCNGFDRLRAAATCHAGWRTPAVILTRLRVTRAGLRNDQGVGTRGAERQQRDDDGEGELPHKRQSITRSRAPRSTGAGDYPRGHVHPVSGSADRRTEWDETTCMRPCSSSINAALLANRLQLPHRCGVSRRSSRWPSRCRRSLMELYFIAAAFFCRSASYAIFACLAT